MTRQLKVKVPIAIWLVSIPLVLTSVLGLYFLPVYVRVGAVPQPVIFVLNAALSIVCAIGLMRLRAWSLVAYIPLKIAMFAMMLVAPVWFMGQPVTLTKLLSSAILPAAFIAVALAYRRRLQGWPARLSATQPDAT